jgi:hypothetical protein
MSTVNVAEIWRERVRNEERAARNQEVYNSSFNVEFGGRSPFAPALRPMACLPLHINMLDSAQIANGMKGCYVTTPRSITSAQSSRGLASFSPLHTAVRASSRAGSPRSMFPPIATAPRRGFGQVKDQRSPWR